MRIKTAARYAVGSSLPAEKVLSEGEIRREIINVLNMVVPNTDSRIDIISNEQDLLEFVDSFDFVRMLMTLEEVLSLELDLTAIDLGHIVNVGNLIQFIRMQKELQQLQFDNVEVYEQHQAKPLHSPAQSADETEEEIIQNIYDYLVEINKIIKTKSEKIQSTIAYLEKKRHGSKT